MKTISFIQTYDAGGNQTRIKTATGIWNVTYNAENRPIRFEREGDASVIECTYDYMGRRHTRKIIVNASISSYLRYIYRGYLQIAAIDAVSGVVRWFLFWDPTQPTATRPLAIRKDSTWYAYGWDLTKNVTEVFGKAGYLRTAYTPYGEATATGDITQPLTWSSEYSDDELALIYYNYRHYNPTDGRWINRDPIEEQGGVNLYVFVRNNSTSYFDHIGLIITPDQGQRWTKQFINNIHAIDNRTHTAYIEDGINACAGYDSIIASVTDCKTSEGYKVKDTYPKFAKEACLGFIKMYTTKGQVRNSVVCVADCLVNEEKINSMYECCYKRNSERLKSHVYCYMKCGFIMDFASKWDENVGVPDGAWEVGYKSLLPDYIYDRSPVLYKSMQYVYEQIQYGVRFTFTLLQKFRFK